MIDVVKGDIKSILSILWAIFIHFDVHKNGKSHFIYLHKFTLLKLLISTHNIRSLSCEIID